MEHKTIYKKGRLRIYSTKNLTTLLHIHMKLMSLDFPDYDNLIRWDSHKGFAEWEVTYHSEKELKQVKDNLFLYQAFGSITSYRHTWY